MRQTTLELSEKVMGKLVSARPGGGSRDHLALDTWEWPQGVALYGMLKVWQATGDRAVLDTAAAWYDKHLRQGLPPRNVNTVAPLLGMALLYEETHTEAYRAVMESWGEWIMREMPRTREGGLQHITSDDENVQQLWDDTLYMTVLFLYRAGCALGHPEWKSEAEYQFLLHIKYLHSQQTGLWYHGYTFLERGHFAGAFWARGNSWFTAGGVDFVEMLGEGGPARRLVLETWREQCAALRELQDEQTGLWHTLLDDPGSYLETSASAAIAYGLLKGVRLGLLDEGYRACAEKACEGVLSQIAPDGTVLGVSYGTPMGHTLDFYREVPIQPTAYGQGLAFLMLTEKLR